MTWRRTFVPIATLVIGALLVHGCGSGPSTPSPNTTTTATTTIPATTTRNFINNDATAGPQWNITLLFGLPGGAVRALRSSNAITLQTSRAPYNTGPGGFEGTIEGTVDGTPDEGTFSGVLRATVGTCVAEQAVSGPPVGRAGQLESGGTGQYLWRRDASDRPGPGAAGTRRDDGERQFQASSTTISDHLNSRLAHYTLTPDVAEPPGRHRRHGHGDACPVSAACAGTWSVTTDVPWDHGRLACQRHGRRHHHVHRRGEHRRRPHRASHSSPGPGASAKPDGQPARTVDVAPISPGIRPPSKFPPQAPTPGNVSLAVATTCSGTWTASSDVPWITGVAPGTGTSGEPQSAYVVAASTGGRPPGFRSRHGDGVWRDRDANH